MISENNPDSTVRKIAWFFLFVFFLYLFLLSIQMMGLAFKCFGKGFAENLLQTTGSPLAGLFIGLLATSLTQSSSTTTSIVVGLVAGGAIPLHNAVPIIMGANMGTTVTNTIVSLGHIGRRTEFRRAFAASLVHDAFNILSVVVLFPLQYCTGFLEHGAEFLTELVSGSSGAKFSSPLALMTGPVADWAGSLLGYSAVPLLVLSLVLLFLALRYMVRYMKLLIMQRAEVVFERVIFRTPYHGLLFGFALTGLVQSSSVTTSLIVPLAGAGLLRLERVFPYTLGANMGTTVTAMLAATATGEPAAVSVAFAHLLFNLSGIAAFWWIPSLPVGIARRAARLAALNRKYALVYVLVLFFVVPLSLIYLLE